MKTWEYRKHSILRVFSINRFALFRKNIEVPKKEINVRVYSIYCPFDKHRFLGIPTEGSFRWLIKRLFVFLSKNLREGVEKKGDVMSSKKGGDGRTNKRGGGRETKWIGYR